MAASILTTAIVAGVAGGVAESAVKIGSRRRDVHIHVHVHVHVHVQTGGELSPQLASDALVIGRDPKCDILLDDRFVSRRHALVIRIGADFELIDLASLNGTWVNGDRITRPTRIKVGDRLAFGESVITVGSQLAQLLPA